MSKIAVLEKFMANDWTLVVRNRRMSIRTERLIGAGMALWGLVVLGLIFPGISGGSLHRYSQYLPYLPLPVALLWGYFRLRVCFGEHRVVSGLLLTKGTFLACRYWSYSEIDCVGLKPIFRNCTLTFLPKDESDTTLRVSVPKKSEQFKSIVLFLSQRVDPDRLDQSVKKAWMNIQTGRPAFS